MRPDHAPTIHRTDYRPLAWRVEIVDLHFTLDPSATIVRNRMRVVRNPGVEAGPLCLFAQSLERLSLSVDGAAPAPERLRETDDGLEVDIDGDSAEVEVVTRLAPDRNTTLTGLYVSRGGFFTQCEAEGFRRITCFPDRPDVMARYMVTLEADKANCPVLLANGNLIEEGDLPAGRHYAKWEDPFPKPSYLFALVASKLVSLERRIETLSGREVLLQVWVEDGQLDRTPHAMESLIHALRWDEEKFGLELDLDRFMIVAVSDFNMGAMENKGLNIFNSKYVLAKPETATDADFEGIESVVAHEYFHNWTGNRVTCRDWFQLTLKEGLTVFRDQQFSADMMAAAADSPTAAESARAVVRIDNVRMLRAAQFPEDSGPMAHPIRPDSYQEINNFYTATVYEKGAEVIRMLRTLLGEEGFRSGMDLYFEYHDGQAVTCDDFVASMADASGRNLDQFMRWYSQAGTPRLKATCTHDAAAKTFTLTLAQTSNGAGAGEPLLIPVAVGLIGPDGADLPLRIRGEVGGRATTTRLLELGAAKQSWTFVDIAGSDDGPPVPSLLRGFSAPVILELDESEATLAFRMAHDADPFNRWDAAQRYFERVILQAAGRPEVPVADQAFLAAYRRLLVDDTLDPAFRALTLALPPEATLLEAMAPADPIRLRTALIALTRQLGSALSAEWLRLYDRLAVPGPYRYHPADAGRRSLRNLALRFLCAAGDAGGIACAETQFAAAANMSERFGALAALVQSAAPGKAAALARFEADFRDDALVLDKWFALQAGAWRWDDGGRSTLATVRALLHHPRFSPANPNNVYALLGGFFRANPAEFHDPAGDGYAFWVEQVAALDAINPHVSARLARALERWQHLAPAAQTRIKAALLQLAATKGLSGDVREIVDKALG